MIHFSPYDGKIHAGPMIADIGLWDAYRSHLPLHFLLYPERAGLILRGLLNAYAEGGWFPKWLSPRYRRGMPTTQAEIIFADAWFKGVRDFDANFAYEGLWKNGTEPGDMYRGRLGLASYDRLGFVANEVVEGAVSRTLQFAYADFCLARLAGTLEHSADSAHFQQRSGNWRNVFDDSMGFPRGRAADGSWMPLDPYE